MISDLDSALRQMLVENLPVKNGEINIEFDQPRREWSARLSRPTLNLFLYDVRENTTLRQADWQVERSRDGTATRRRAAVRMDLNYLVTAWASDPEDEHRLLSRVLLALLRFPEVPAEMLPESLQSQPVPVPVRIAGPEALRDAAELWGVLDNELRPAIPCTLTLAFDPFQPVTGPLVRSRRLRFQQAGAQESAQESVQESPPDEFWMVGGVLHSSLPLPDDARLVLKERNLIVPLNLQGEFVIGNLESGEYTLELEQAGERASYRITVPSPSYDLELAHP